MCVREKDVFTVCCHVRLGGKKECRLARAIGFLRQLCWPIFAWTIIICSTVTKERLRFSFCPKCTDHFSVGGDPHSETAILNYWYYKNRNDYRSPIEPSRCPFDKVFHSDPSDHTDAALLQRLELVSLSGVLREDTVLGWFEREVNKKGVVPKPCGLIGGLSHIRQVTLMQAIARQFVQPLPANGYKHNPPLLGGPRKVEAHDNEDYTAFEATEATRMHAHPLRSNHVTNSNHHAHHGRHNKANVYIAATEGRYNTGKPLPKIPDEAESQQPNPKQSHILRRMSNISVVGVDADELAHFHSGLDNPESVCSNGDDKGITDSVQIGSRHETTIVETADISSLHGLVHGQDQQPMTGNRVIPPRVPSHHQGMQVCRAPSVHSMEGEVDVIPMSLREELELAGEVLESPTSSLGTISPVSALNIEQDGGFVSTHTVPTSAQADSHLAPVPPEHLFLPYRPPVQADSHMAPIQPERTYLPYRPPGALEVPTVDKPLRPVYGSRQYSHRPSEAYKNPAHPDDASLALHPPGVDGSRQVEQIPSFLQAGYVHRRRLLATRSQPVSQYRGINRTDRLPLTSEGILEATKWRAHMGKSYGPGSPNSINVTHHPRPLYYHYDNECSEYTQGKPPANQTDPTNPAFLPPLLRLVSPELERIATMLPQPGSPPAHATSLTASWSAMMTRLNLAAPENRNLALELMALSQEERFQAVKELLEGDSDGLSGAAHVPMAPENRNVALELMALSEEERFQAVKEFLEGDRDGL